MLISKKKAVIYGVKKGLTTDTFNFTMNVIKIIWKKSEYEISENYRYQWIYKERRAVVGYKVVEIRRIKNNGWRWHLKKREEKVPFEKKKRQILKPVDKYSLLSKRTSKGSSNASMRLYSINQISSKDDLIQATIDAIFEKI